MMLARVETRKKNGVESGKLLNETDVISKLLYLDKNPPRNSFYDSNSRSESVPKAPSLEPKRSIKNGNEDPSPRRDKKSIWNWKALKAFSNDKSRKFTCCFSLQVHSIEDLAVSFKELSLCVHWKKRDEDLVTRPVKVFDGIAKFEEKLMVTCSVYGTKGGPHNSVKYEAKHCMLYASVFGAPDLDLGKHRVDLTRLLPLTWEELEEEKSSGKWTTCFKLKGKARGAIMNVSFGYTVLSDMKQNRQKGTKFGNGDQKSTMRAVESLPCLANTTSLSLFMEEMKELHEILPASKSDTDDVNVVDQKFDEYKLDDTSIASKPEPDALVEHCEPTLPPSSVVSESNEYIEKETKEDDFYAVSKVESNEVVEINPGMGVNSEESYELCPLNEVSHVNQEDTLVVQDSNSKMDDQFSKESLMRELELALDGITNLEAALDSPDPDDLEDYMEHNVNYETNRKSSASLDEVTDSVANEFLNMLGIDHSPFSVSSESEPESPRERLLRQFEKETLANGCSLFDFGMADREELESGFDISTSWNLSGVLDMPFVLQDDVQEHQMGANGRIKVRAKVLEDLETEALMHEWGLNEKAFQYSPSGSSVGLGSPFKFYPGDPLDLPPLGDGLGPLLRTKNGGFLRSMNPSLFWNSKIGGSLIMQVSSPVVLPAEMGPSVMDILQRLASIGIEKLSMQANKLMPLEDITGKTMEQVAWEAAPTLDGSESQYLLQHDSEVVQKKIKTRSHVPSSNMHRFNEMSSDYVSLEDLAPLAMDKIEALSMEGLRIQSDMSDEDAPSSINAQSIGEILALKGKGFGITGSLGLGGAAGLQLLDIKDSCDDVDGLMGLSLTLNEWIRLDSGDFGDEDQPSKRTSKILAAHHATSLNLKCRGSKEEKRRGRKCRLFGNNFTVALMVQLHNPIRNYEPVGAPMLALIQVERVFVPPKPKIYCTISAALKKNNQEDVKEEEPRYRIIEVHVAGLKTEPGKTKLWGTTTQQQSGSRWLLANGMGKSNKHRQSKFNFASKSSPPSKVQPGDTLWSISSHIDGTGAKWKELEAPNPHIRNPNILFPNETIRLR
ncbi:PLASTID MOVEMENT IMPAIRED1-RELATED1 [Hibiscus trionum]|uniref:PLASTID MOVEMENT IMPAIRED1-RELATED1 n=1 Tax=Hibiscus trionum TaxID=183268 RepID=A0A9W7IPL6_HIBTR|nr:PLASTID MOVEMENT IMPAIRED1-RELATED1 [Hibiscus trionum]